MPPNLSTVAARTRGMIAGLPRRRPRPRTVIAATLLLVTAAVVVDRVAARLVAHRLTGAFACVTGVGGGTVRLSPPGFPFLAHVATGRIPTLEVFIDDLVRDQLRLTDVEIRLDGVGLSGGGLGGGGLAGIRPDGMAGSVTLPYDELRRIAERGQPQYGPSTAGVLGDGQRFDELDLSYAGDGKLAVGTELHLAGSAMPVTVVGEPYVSGGRFSIDPDLIELGSQQLPGALFGDTLLGRASSELPTDLPLDAKIVGVEATTEGMRFELRAPGLSIAEAFASRPRVFDRDGRASCWSGAS